jgi:hypothetical protein
MDKHKFSISISGSKKDATEKINGLAILASKLSAETITALAKLVKSDPAKVEAAKHYLGVS